MIVFGLSALGRVVLLAGLGQLRSRQPGAGVLVGLLTVASGTATRPARARRSRGAPAGLAAPAGYTSQPGRWVVHLSSCAGASRVVGAASYATTSVQRSSPADGQDRRPFCWPPAGSATRHGHCAVRAQGARWQNNFMITVHLTYVVDPYKLDSFEEYGRRWISLVTSSG